MPATATAPNALFGCHVERHLKSGAGGCCWSISLFRRSTGVGTVKKL